MAKKILFWPDVYLIILLAMFFTSCGDDGSGVNSFEQTPETSLLVDDANSSSSVDVLPSSAMVNESSSSENLDESSSSAESSSSEKKELLSSSAEKEKSSSSEVLDESSSSMKNENSSSSVKTAESSSAEIFEESSSSVKNESSSSSEKSESSSSEIKKTSSSSENKSSSSIGSSSSSEKGESSSSKIIETSSASNFLQPCKTKTEDNCIYGTLYDDRDGKTYKTVKIGEQWWMAENLNYETDSLRPSARSVCHPDPDTCAKYGRLYFWNIAMDTLNTGCGKYVTCKPSEPVQGVCPKGWHIPSELEMIVLLNNVGGEKINAAQNLRASDSWTSPVKCSSIDPYGFSALAAGLYYNTNYQDFHAETRFTLSSEYDKERRKVLVITSYSSTELGCPKKTAEIEYFWNKSNTASVRCIKD